MRWAKLERLRFIGRFVLTYGHIRRRDLRVAFGVSEAQASVDLRDYQHMQPGVLTYDSTEKAYVWKGYGA